MIQSPIYLCLVLKEHLVVFVSRTVCMSGIRVSFTKSSTRTSERLKSIYVKSRSTRISKVQFSNFKITE